MIREVGKKKRKRKNESKLNERGKLAQRCMEIDFADSQYSAGNKRTYIVIQYSHIIKQNHVKFMFSLILVQI